MNCHAFAKYFYKGDAGCRTGSSGSSHVQEDEEPWLRVDPASSEEVGTGLLHAGFNTALYTASKRLALATVCVPTCAIVCNVINV